MVAHVVRYVRHRKREDNTALPRLLPNTLPQSVVAHAAVRFTIARKALAHSAQAAGAAVERLSDEARPAFMSDDEDAAPEPAAQQASRTKATPTRATQKKSRASEQKALTPLRRSRRLRAKVEADAEDSTGGDSDNHDSADETESEARSVVSQASADSDAAVSPPASASPRQPAGRSGGSDLALRILCAETWVGHGVAADE